MNIKKQRDFKKYVLNMYFFGVLWVCKESYFTLQLNFDFCTLF